MKRVVFFLLMLTVVIQLSGRDTIPAYTLETVPNIHVQDKRFYVSDPSHILRPDAADSVNAVCRTLEQKTGIETAVVMLPSIGENDPFDFGYQLFRKWGVGKKKNNNGLLVLFVQDQRKIRFITGYGLEGDLPDALCKRIQQRYMLPAFRRGDYNKGMVQGMSAVYRVLEDSMNPDSTSDNDLSPWNYLFVIAAVLLFILVPYLITRRKERCPRCGKHTLKRTSSQIAVMRNGHREQMSVFRCSHCGYTITRRKDLDDDNLHTGAGPFLGGFLGGSLLGSGTGRSGGFEGGGSFGGGDTGGGGAGSDW